MTTVITIVTPVFGILMLGYAAGRFNLFTTEATRALSAFVFNFAIPPLLFRSMALAELPPALPWGLLLAYYLPAAVVWLLGSLAGRWLFDRSLAQQSIGGYSAAFGNTVLMGIPLVLTTFGDQASLALFLIIGTHSPLLMTLLTLLLELARGRPSALLRLPADTVRGMLSNPVIVGLASGTLFNLMDWTIPTPVDAIAKALGQAAMPCALFVLGAGLSQYRIVGNLPESVTLVVLKMLAMPAMVWFIGAHVFELEPLSVQVLVLLAALPSGVNAYLFAQRYEVGMATASTTIFLSTTLSIVTLSLLLVILTASPP